MPLSVFSRWPSAQCHPAGNPPATALSEGDAFIAVTLILSLQALLIPVAEGAGPASIQGPGDESGYIQQFFNWQL